MAGLVCSGLEVAAPGLPPIGLGVLATGFVWPGLDFTGLLVTCFKAGLLASGLAGTDLPLASLAGVGRASGEAAEGALTMTRVPPVLRCEATSGRSGFAERGLAVIVTLNVIASRARAGRGICFGILSQAALLKLSLTSN